MPLATPAHTRAMSPDGPHKKLNLVRRSLLVIFQGRNFHQRPFRISPMHGLAVVSQCLLREPFGILKNSLKVSLKVFSYSSKLAMPSPSPSRARRSPFAFKPGSFQRSNANCDGTRFMVIESDTLPKDEVGAVFSYLQKRLHYKLHCIIDTAGKSLHAWFDAPRNKILEDRLKAGLTAFGCDPKVFTYSQPVRVPGAWRDGKMQRLLWLKH
jgi:hypothetical protein